MRSKRASFATRDTSIGDARSLQGGTLLVTPLLGADGNVYAVAQGSVSIGGFQAATGLADGAVVGESELDDEAKTSLDRANESVIPTVKMDSAASASVSPRATAGGCMPSSRPRPGTGPCGP